jgi:DNA-binding beta-propeller fold protein YncE
MACVFGGSVHLAAAKLNCVCIFDKHRRVSEVVAGAGAEYGSELTLNEPQGLCCAATEGGYHLYVADTNNHKIEKMFVNTAGDVENPVAHICSFGGEKGSAAAAKLELRYPFDVAVNEAGTTLYVAEPKCHRIQVFDVASEISAALGEAGSGQGQLQSPCSVFVANDNRIYVADTRNHRIQVFDHRCGFVSMIGSKGNGNGQFMDPFGVAVDGSGKVIVADTQNDRVQIFGNNHQHCMTVDGFNHPFAVGAAAAGPAAAGFVVCDSNDYRLQYFCEKGSLLKTLISSDAILQHLTGGLLQF